MQPADPSTSTLEAVATAIREASGISPLWGADVAEKSARAAITAHLASLAEQGWVMVPRKPSVAQLAAALWLEDEPSKRDELLAAMAVDSYPAASSRGLRADVIRATAQIAMDYRAMVSHSPAPALQAGQEA